MKKIITLLLTGVIATGLCVPTCTHVHSEECGKDGENCQHECVTIEPCREDLPKL